MTSAQDIAIYIRSLNRHSTIRDMAEAILAGHPEAIVQMQPVFTTLAHGARRPWRESCVAAWILGEADLDSQEFDAAAGILTDLVESSNRTGRWRRLRPLLLRYLALAPFCLIIDISSMEGPVLTILMPFIWLVGNAAFERRTSACIRVAAIEALGRLQSPESLAPLCRALFDRNAAVREAASEALHALLPLLTQEQYGVYGEETIRNLGRALTHPDTLLAQRALHALDSVGSSIAIPYVERLMNSAKTARLRGQANQVLATLLLRRQTEADSLTLIRAVKVDDPALLDRSYGSKPRTQETRSLTVRGDADDR